VGRLVLEGEQGGADARMFVAHALLAAGLATVMLSAGTQTGDTHIQLGPSLGITHIEMYDRAGFRPEHATGVTDE
jgi:hypothetical protein